MNGPLLLGITLLVLILGAVVLILLIRSQDQSRQLQSFERRLDTLNQRFFALSVWIETLDQRLEGSTEVRRQLPAAPQLPEALPEGSPAPALAPPSASPPDAAPRLAPAAVVPSPAPAAPPAQGPRIWKRLERRLIENWTGILGVLVVVAGVTFVTINVALRLDPFQRFALTTAAALALALPSWLFGRREPWRDLSDWMRSGGGALFLFACAAAGGLPQLGLQWLDDPLQALGLLSLGVLVNLTLAAIARNQTIASLHVVASLVPLLIVPQTALTLAIASLVTLVGSRLPLGHRWDRHRLLVTGAYALFHGSWFLRSQAALADDDRLRAAAALAAVLVFGAGIARQQGERQPAGRTLALPLALLLSQWGALALALLLYPQHAAVRATALAGAAAVALLLSRSARRRGLGWLQRSEALVGQSLAVAAVLSLGPLIANAPLLVFVLLVECLLFLRLGVETGEGTIRRVGWGLSAVAGLALTFTGIGEAATGHPLTDQLQTSGVLIGAAVLTALVQAVLQRRDIPLPLPPLLGWVSAAQVFVGATLVAPEDWRPALNLLAMGGLLLLARRQRPPGLLTGTAVAAAMAHGWEWGWMLASHPLPLATLAVHLLPLTGLALVLGWVGRGRRSGLLGLHLLALDAGLGVFLWLDPISPALAGLAWLGLALVALHGSCRLGGRAIRHGLVIGLGYLTVFTTFYLLVIAPSPTLLDLGAISLSGRLLVELAAIAVFLHWYGFRAPAELQRLALWPKVQPCFLELSLLMLSLTILEEIAILWRPVVWSLLALAMIAPPLRRLGPPRLQTYGLFSYWVALAAVPAMLTVLSPPWPQGFDQPQQVALLAIALQVGFILASYRWLDRESLRQPGGWSLLTWIGHRVANRPHLWLCYPLFAVVAYLLARRFDSSLLTLLWAAEAFGIYVLSVVLREQQFRNLALLALGGCLLRLLTIDMAQADLGLRGLVFIGVGLLMLAMNAIYNRYRGRFE